MINIYIAPILFSAYTYFCTNSMYQIKRIHCINSQNNIPYRNLLRLLMMQCK